MAEQEQRRFTAASGQATLPPAEVLLNRIVVVDGPRSADLVAGLTTSGMQARAVSAESLQSLIAGLVVVEEASDHPTAGAILQVLRRRRAAVAAVALADLDRCGVAFLSDLADVVLPAGSSVEVVALQLRSLARLIATDPPSGEPETITVRNVTIDLVQRLVRAGNRVIDLTPTEFLLLAHLARRRGVVSHAELVGELHGGIMNEREAKNMLKVHIWRLRAKLAEALPDTNLIVTVRGFGYLLERRSGNLTQPPRPPD
ncbi:MAG: winged helix-turn-helix domain-containing protein [Dehalococcoidia bacterium]